ncbi:MAG: hypothetical protein AAF945_16735, partial [Actinomycetota bacterium]
MPMLTADQIDDFTTDGFLVIDRIVDDEAVAELRTAYQRLLDDPGIAAGDRQLGGITRQIMMPSLADPDFDENEVVDAVAPYPADRRKPACRPVRRCRSKP